MFFTKVIPYLVLGMIMLHLLMRNKYLEVTAKQVLKKEKISSKC